MSNSVFKAPPISWAKIDSITSIVRSNLGLSRQSYFPVMDVIENVMDLRWNWFSFQVCSVEDMGNIEGCLCPNGTYLQLREDVYEAALKGDGRARFTAAHELGHYALHANQPLARATHGQLIRPFENSEKQADYFAASLLMPNEFFNATETIHDVMERHGVSYSAAENRLRYLRAKAF